MGRTTRKRASATSAPKKTKNPYIKRAKKSAQDTLKARRDASYGRT